jgi:hypothetical protein
MRGSLESTVTRRHPGVHPFPSASVSSTSNGCSSSSSTSMAVGCSRALPYPTVRLHRNATHPFTAFVHSPRASALPALPFGARDERVRAYASLVDAHALEPRVHWRCEHSPRSVGAVTPSLL